MKTNSFKFKIPDLSKAFLSPTFWIIVVGSFFIAFILLYDEKLLKQSMKNIKVKYPETKGMVVDFLLFHYLTPRFKTQTPLCILPNNRKF